MVAFQLSVFVFGVFKPVVATPISLNHVTIHNYAYIAFFLLIFILTTLVVLKYSFMKNRYVNVDLFHRKSRARPSSTAGTSLLSSKNVHPDNGKAGFLVGFLGSPIWETTVVTKTNLNLNLAIRGAYQHSWYQSRVESDQHTPNHQLNIQDYPSNVFRTSAGALPVQENPSNSTDLCIVRQPDYPMKVYARSERIRRLSLTSIRRTESLQSAIRRKKRESTEKSKQREDESGAVSIPINEIIRLVEETPSIPLSHMPQQPSSVPRSVSPTDDFHGKVNFRFTRNSLPSLPPPVATSTWYTTSVLDPSPATVHVSHPYALLSKVKSRPLCRPLSHNKLSQVHDAHTVPTVRCSAVEDDTSRVSGPTWSNIRGPRQAFAPVNCAVDTCAGVSCFRPTISATTFSDSQPHSMQNTSHRKEKVTNARRSPSIGPSPLRTMILPEVFLDTTGTPTNCLSGNENENVECKRKGLGLRSPPLRTDHCTNRDITDKDRIDIKNRQASICMSCNDDGAKQLLDIIRELVEETKEWDSSLYMDANFKSMVSEYLSEDPLNVRVPSVDLDLAELLPFERRNPNSKETELV